MLAKYRNFIVLPAFVLVAAPFVIFSVIAESSSHDAGFSHVRPLTFEQSAKFFGWPDLRVVGLELTEPTHENLPESQQLRAKDQRPYAIYALFRGSNGSMAPAWRFDQVLARHEIELRSDANEMMNIQLAARAVDYSLIMPGETFSFNEEVGVRSEEKGYMPGVMYQQGEVIKGIGGGICIVSTGLYEAALKAGLKIIERSNHSGPTRYACPGFDSAVVYGVLDLKIKNDTPTPVLIRCEVDDDLLTVTYLGRKTPGIEVALATKTVREIPFKIFTKPDESIPEGELEVKQKARTGLEVLTIRYFKHNGHVVKREVVDTSCYPPRHKIILVPLPAETPEDQTAAEAGTELEAEDTAAPVDQGVPDAKNEAAVKPKANPVMKTPKKPEPQPVHPKPAQPQPVPAVQPSAKKVWDIESYKAPTGSGPKDDMPRVLDDRKQQPNEQPRHRFPKNPSMIDMPF